MADDQIVVSLIPNYLPPHNAHASSIPRMAMITPRCSSRLLLASQPGEVNCTAKFATTISTPIMGSSPLRWAKKSDIRSKILEILALIYLYPFLHSSPFTLSLP